MDTIFLTQNPEEKIPKKPEINLLESLRKDQIEKKQGGHNSKVIYIDSAKQIQNFVAGFEDAAGTGFFLPPGSFFSLSTSVMSPISTNLRKINNLSSLNLNINVDWSLEIYTITSAPDSDFEVPIHLSIISINQNYDYDFLVYGNSSKKQKEQILTFNLGNLRYNLINDVFRFEPYRKSFNLLNTIPSRGLVSSTAEADYFDFNNNGDKLTQAQLEKIFRGDYMNMMILISGDLTSLSTANENFVNNDIISNSVLNFLINVEFEYIGLLANF